MLAFWANGKHSVKGFHPMENSMLIYIYFETNTTLNLFSFIFLTFFCRDSFWWWLLFIIRPKCQLVFGEGDGQTKDLLFDVNRPYQLSSLKLKRGVERPKYLKKWRKRVNGPHGLS